MGSEGYIGAMNQTVTISRRQRGPARRLLAVPGLLLLAAAIMLLAPSLASADTSSTLTVVGTSDVSDSGLIPNVIQPGFQAANPQYTFKYIGTATGTAISDAESGSVGASALIVHAESLENQFVAGGFSQEQYGRALFTNDFVLAGPTADPAGVAANGAHNVAQAFADVAAAGIAGKATFVSRGGTPGTTVEEHQIWALVSTSSLAPTGLALCPVSAANGGGETPVAPGTACPAGGALPTKAQLPAWYVATGLTQGPNVVAANACTGFPSGANTCYVLTDRGTYDYLASGTDPAGSIPGLSIVTRDNSATAPGGAFELINYFHGYIINPSKPGQAVNLAAAQAFLNYLTSPTVQAQVAAYLAHTSDPGGAPFKPTASPLITQTGITATYKAGKPATVTGTVTNAEPGYPALSGVPVTIEQVAGAVPSPVATGTTTATGAYRVRFTPPANGSYEVTTGQIAKIENATLNPVFGDLLTPGSSSPVTVTVDSALTGLRARSIGSQAVVIGSVAPGTGHVKGTVTLFARKPGAKKYRKLTTVRLSSTDGNFATVVKLAAAKWQLQAKYQDPKQVVASKPRTTTVTVRSKASSSVSFASVKLAKSSLTVSGAIRPAAAKGGVKLELLALKTTNGSPAKFSAIAKVTIRSGKSKATLHAKLKGTGRWLIEVEAVRKGAPTTFTKLRAVTVKPAK
jgi:tungstate transport system substrate-binding protein